MKLNEILDQSVYVENEKIGEVKDVYVDTKTWEVTHFEIQLPKKQPVKYWVQKFQFEIHFQSQLWKKIARALPTKE